METFESSLGAVQPVDGSVFGVGLEPFLHTAAMDDWVLLDFRHIVPRNRVGIIFGWGVDVEGCNTALLVAEDVSSTEWFPGKKRLRWEQFEVADAAFVKAGSRANMQLGFAMQPNAHLKIEAGSFVLHLGYSQGHPGRTGPPPNHMVDSDEEIMKYALTWQSPFVSKYSRSYAAVG